MFPSNFVTNSLPIFLPLFLPYAILHNFHPSFLPTFHSFFLYNVLQNFLITFSPFSFWFSSYCSSPLSFQMLFPFPVILSSPSPQLLLAILIPNFLAPSFRPFFSNHVFHTFLRNFLPISRVPFIRWPRLSDVELSLHLHLIFSPDFLPSISILSSVFLWALFPLSSITSSYITFILSSLFLSICICQFSSPFFGVSFLFSTPHYSPPFYDILSNHFFFPTDILFTFSLSIIYFIPALFPSFPSSHIPSKYSFIPFFSSFFLFFTTLLLYFSLHNLSFLSFVFLTLFPFFLSVVLPQILFISISFSYQTLRSFPWLP